MKSPGSVWTNGLSMSFSRSGSSRTLLEENDQQHEHFRQNRHAFEQEERQVHGAGDLCRRAGLARDALGRGRRELADAHGGADNDEAQTQSGAEVMQNSC